MTTTLASPTRVLLCISLGAVALTPSVARASDQVGAYARPLKVIEYVVHNQPLRVKIVGVLAVANEAVYPGYTAAQCGYAYYECPSGKETICAMEWADIQKAVDTGGCVGFGARRDQNGLLQDNGRVRPQSEALGTADPYRIGFGVSTRVNCKQASPDMTTPTDVSIACALSPEGDGGVPLDAAPTPDTAVDTAPATADTARPSDSSAGVDTAPAGGGKPDAGAGTAPPDAGGTTGTPPKGDDGGGCTVGGRSGAGGALVAMALFVSAALARRRRRR